MKDCCKYWLRNCKPIRPSDGQFSETQLCPKCQSQRKLTFEEVPPTTPEGKSEYVLIDPWSQEWTQDFE
jgi:hypothetical protein